MVSRRELSQKFLIRFFKMKTLLRFTLLFLSLAISVEGYSTTRIKDLTRIQSSIENSLVGYGLVTGLAGTGDSYRSSTTTRSISNMLKRFGLSVDEKKLKSRNVAAVMVVTKLPPYAEPGDKLDVNVTSLGDARSLVGGTLFRTDLKGADGKIYALAQGSLSVGGFKYDFNGNLIQKNHPTAATIIDAAIVQKSVYSPLIDRSGKTNFVLNNPDLTTASRIAKSINSEFGGTIAIAKNAAKIQVTVPESFRKNEVEFLSRLEVIQVVPDSESRVVVNEKTGTVVAGGKVRIDPVSLTHGNLMLNVETEFQVSQPSFVSRVGDGVSSVVVANSEMNIEERVPISLNLKKGTTISELVTALNRVKATPRDTITILQLIKRAGALHAKLIIQ